MCEVVKTASPYKRWVTVLIILKENLFLTSNRRLEAIFEDERVK